MTEWPLTFLALLLLVAYAPADHRHRLAAAVTASRRVRPHGDLGGCTVD